jgi:CubicO group peptidase (beta-lactamase class C family)
LIRPGIIIDTLSKQSSSIFLKENLLDPLGTCRTFIRKPKDSNVAAPYNILSDGTPFRIPFSEISDDTMMLSAVSVRTSMTDLVRLCAAILNEMNTLVPYNEHETTLQTGLLKKWFGQI